MVKETQQEAVWREMSEFCPFRWREVFVCLFVLFFFVCLFV